MLTSKILLALPLLAVGVAAFSWGPKASPKAALATVQAVPEGAKSLVVAGGCFWCVEQLYDELQGVYFAESGYAGGSRAGVSYDQVMSGGTGHAEAVKIVYDPKQVTAQELLRMFFVVHDPTTLNRQGPDVGPQYRSAVFYASPEDKALALKVRDEIVAKKIWKNPIVTTFEPLKNYTRAEEYHQDYFAKYEKASPIEQMKMNAGYCSVVIQPKVLKFRKEYAGRLKKKQ